MTAPLGVILAGGRAMRMGGGDKGLLRLGRATILERVRDRLEPQVAALALSANGDPERFAGFMLPVLPDGIEDAGPLAGLLAGLDWAAGEGATHVVTVAGDTPFFPCDLVPRLQLAAEGAGAAIALAATRGADGLRLHPTFGLWPVALRDDLRAALAAGTRRIGRWATGMGAAEALFAIDRGDPFLNVNTPEDLALARDLAEGTA
ncbi:molybdenum cofactor guanylyltransferase MobA [Palleronia sp. LCG004]|uniref:molybdenum cofactor guanylyltransferase MobA n=1 Tax=Palleronia sp. LCG004 TaxID=3079304 RepID=UPI002941EFA8|nr:molybdenum cofactor guanylyltransferase MobA [Palleronia sp. LCG004]WOI57608.1 molybdenum cofactor guanylyltransferase MobA [Palleronia sp. LCG004]